MRGLPHLQRRRSVPERAQSSLPGGTITKVNATLFGRLIRTIAFGAGERRACEQELVHARQAADTAAVRRT
ncbi:hypothetical protein OHA21_14775 [Actinoplanes sp. NBC_00393]|uniref:hypothetical protein n=1 Tax=Actinoplanes sp. NBC_00393 TaxID=2975953 RepID=UPI002E24ADD4